jgi:hypothetical protein
MSDTSVPSVPPPSPANSLWRSAWVTLLCAALIEVVIHCCWATSDEKLIEFRYYRPDKAPAIGDSLVYWKYRELLTPEKDPRYYPVALIGDSSCTMGIIPDVVQEESGWDTVNLAMNGGATLDVQNELLELHIAKHGAPRLVVMQMSDHVLCGSVRLSQVHEYRQQILDWSALVQNKTSFSWRNPLLAIPSVRRRPMMLHDWWSFWSSQPKDYFLTAARDPWPSDAQVGELLKETKGYLEFPPPAGKPPRISPFRLVKDWLPMFERLFQMSQRYEFDLLMILNPLTDSTMLPDSAEERRQIADEMAAFAQSYPRVKIHRAGFTRVYPEEVMGDGVHMARAGAERNSREIAGWLGEYQQERGGLATRPRSPAEATQQR